MIEDVGFEARELVSDGFERCANQKWGGAEDQFRNNSAQAVEPAFRQSSLKHKG